MGLVGQLGTEHHRHFGPCGQVLDTVILGELSVVGATWSIYGVVGCFYFIPVNPSERRGNIDTLVWSLLPCRGIHMKESGYLMSVF